MYNAYHGRGVIVIIEGNGPADPSSSPGWRCWLFLETLGKGMTLTILPPAMEE